MVNKKTKEQDIPPTGTERELVLLRTKLEIRTWFLRASLAVNAGLIAGLIIRGTS